MGYPLQFYEKIGFGNMFFSRRRLPFTKRRRRADPLLAVRIEENVKFCDADQIRGGVDVASFVTGSASFERCAH